MITKKKGLLIGALALSCCATLGLGAGLTGLAATQSPAPQTTETQTTETTPNNAAYYVNKEESDVGYRMDPNSILNGVLADLALDDKLTIRNVIDLEEMEAQDKPFIHLQPIVSEVGKAEYTKITLEIIDTYDASNYLKIQIGATPQHEDDSTTGYFLACASNGQKLTGYESSMDKLHINNQYGQWSVFSFSCNISHSSGTGFYYNTKEKQIFAVDYRGTKKMIIDLDDPAFFGTYLWDGFTTNEVYCRVSCGSYKKDRASIMVSQYGNYDLSKAELHDEVAPALTINYGEYTKENLPSALRGSKYKVFEASSFDTVDGSVETDVKVYTDYYSPNKKEVTVRSGYFTPKLTQPHYVVYTATDAHGNISEEVLTINVVSACDPLRINFENVAYTTVEGDAYAIPAYTLSGGLGNINLTIKATLNGQEIDIEKNAIRPYAAGALKVVYTLEDYIGQTEVVEHEITVTDATKPTFIEEPILPKYLLARNRYTLPALNAYDYITAEGAAIPTTISVVENGKTTTLTDGSYTVGEATEVEIVYTATIGASTNEYRVTLPVRSVHNGEDLDMGKFFLTGSNGSAVAKGYSIELTATADESFEFVNFVTILNLSMEFSLGETYTNVQKFHVYLTDIVDNSKQLKFTYVLSGDKLSFYANDNEAGVVPISGTPAKNMRMYLGFNSDEKKVFYDISNNNILPIASFLNGKAFDGFTDGLAYLSYQFEEVEEEATLCIHTINGHYFSEETRDWIAPTVEFIGDVGGEYTLWDECVLPKIVASDVLSGKVDAYVTLTAPSGNYVTTVDGNVLNNFRYDGSELKVVFAEYGDYLLSVTAQDNTDNLAPVHFVYSVVDKVKPTMQVAGEVVTTAKVGQSINLPKATAVDNLSEELTVYVYVIAPNGYVLELNASDTGFKATKAGVYVVVYSVADEEGNVDSKYYKIVVTEE